jgi:4'-phosphopantetheinyl transferase
MTDPLPRSGLEPLGPSDVHVWFRLTEAVTDRTLSDALELLSADERARHDRLRFPWDRRDFALAHALLRASLSRYSAQPASSWRFIQTDRGKPVLDPPSYGFNLSHTRGLVACVVARGGDVGIDVERVEGTSDIGSLAASRFSRFEVEQLAACPAGVRHDRFFEIWTLKEAYAKAIGLGLGHPLDSTTFDLTSRDAIGFAHDSGEAGQWRFHLFSPAPRFRLALAVRSAPAPHIVTREWPADE